MTSQFKNSGGLSRIQQVFEKTRAQKRAALMPYYTLGYPTPETSLEILTAISTSGADLIELGMPFSDPLADGPTIQASTQVALQAGMTIPRCLEITSQLRERGAEQALILMGYINPLVSYGVERFVQDAATAGADGLIVADLPLEESGDLETACRKENLALVCLLAPDSPPERVEMIAHRTSGFLYLVSLAGVTGARKDLPPHLPEFVQRVRKVARTPLAVGFGVSTPQHARLVGELADGVIVGSALIDAVKHAADPVKAAGDFVASLRAALENH